MPPWRPCASLGSADALVVLTHDRDVDGPVLAAALDDRRRATSARWARVAPSRRGPAGYASAGCRSEAIAAIHGPAGLDIGARTPGEIALSIAAEIVSLRSGAGVRLPARPQRTDPPRRLAHPARAIPRHDA